MTERAPRPDGGRRGGRRVVVTGIGMVTPLGLGAEATWAATLRADNGIGPIRRFDPTGFPVRFAAEAPLAGTSAALKASLVEVALAEALAQSLVPGGDRLGVCLGSEAARPPIEWLLERRVVTADEVQALAPDAPTRLTARIANARGPRSTVSTACTSSSQAIGEAMLRIRRGEVDAMVAGGVDVLSEPLMVVGFSKLGALSTRNDAPERASRPFDLHRDGFVLGEGAGFLILEEEGYAIRRGAPILATLDGWGCSCNAWRITDSPPDGRGAATAMLEAIADAGLTPADVGYINAHGTSTPVGDEKEIEAIKAVFGDHAKVLAVSSTKSMHGHLLGAAGALEAAITTLALRESQLPPNANCASPDPACGLDLVLETGAVASGLDAAITSSFAFGGSNAVLVFRRA